MARNKSVTAQRRGTTTRRLRHSWWRHITTNFNPSYVAPYYLRITIKCSTIGVNMITVCIFALIISYEECILTSKFHPDESNSRIVKYLYPTCASHLLCAMLCSFICVLSGWAFCLVNVCRSEVKTERAAVIFTVFIHTFVLWPSCMAFVVICCL